MLIMGAVLNLLVMGDCVYFVAGGAVSVLGYVGNIGTIVSILV